MRGRFRYRRHHDHDPSRPPLWRIAGPAPSRRASVTPTGAPSLAANGAPAARHPDAHPDHPVEV
jgi:uncharacterized Zn-binding protein involved in type VI secretion